MIEVRYIHKDKLTTHHKYFVYMLDAKKYARKVAHTGWYWVSLLIGDKIYEY